MLESHYETLPEHKKHIIKRFWEQPDYENIIDSSLEGYKKMVDEYLDETKT